MRKYLGALSVITALCVVSWAQAPASNQAPAQSQTPSAEPLPNTPPSAPPPAPPYSRYELFLGGSYAEAGLFNAGHWDGLEGWDASLGANATHWLGFVVEGGQYFGTSKIPVAVPAPFPTCPPFCPAAATTFGATTREYNFLFGAHFVRRKWERWTPFGEFLYGHQGARGEAAAEAAQFNEVGTGKALVAGAGIDRRINERFALRIKADYLQTGTSFPLLGKQRQDNFRVSMGVVIRNVRRKKRSLEDETQIEP